MPLVEKELSNHPGTPEFTPDVSGFAVTTTGATSREGNVYPSRVTEFTPDVSGFVLLPGATSREGTVYIILRVLLLRVTSREGTVYSLLMLVGSSYYYGCH